MFKVAILGCENSHANGFLDVIRDEKLDVQVMGVYSEYEGAAEALRDTYGVPVMENYDDFVGQLDGVIINARHGGDHYRFAKPYLNDGIPIYIDKPITVSEEDARDFYRDIVTRGIPVCGGSTLKHATVVKELKAMVKSGEKGEPLGGYCRAPINLKNPYGDFYFYSQHLVQIITEIFGCYPKAVRTCQNGNQITIVVRYDNFDVTGLYSDISGVYYANASFKESVEGGTITEFGETKAEFMEYYALLKGEPQHQSCDDLFAPVFILNAIDRSLQSGKEEPVARM